MNEDKIEIDAMKRRSVLKLIGGAVGAAFMVGYGTSAAESVVAAAQAKSPTPEGEIGPFFADDSATSFNRSNIITNIDGTNKQQGVPLALTLYVYDIHNNYAPIPDAQVDIWHCNSLGVYSDEDSQNSSGDSYLRGYQLTDSTGKVVFNTIIPGWYQGRTTHIHLRVRSKYNNTGSPDDGSNTPQVFFEQSVLDHVSNNVAPYSENGINPTTNAFDHVYLPETQGETLLTITGSYEKGFASTFHIYLPIENPQ